MKPSGIFDRVTFAEAKVARLEKLVLRQADALALARDTIAVMRAELDAVKSQISRVEWPVVEPVKLAPRIAAMAEILAQVAAEYLCEFDVLRGADRCKGPSIARQEAMLRMHEAGHSYPEIGRFLGGRDHTTVQHGAKMARNRRGEV